MAQGIQVRNSQGNIILDSNHQTSSIFGVIPVSSVGQINVSDERFSWGTPYFLLDSIYAGSEVKASFSGNNMTLIITSNTGGLATFKPINVYYGVF